jgi:hypothetical protein
MPEVNFAFWVFSEVRSQGRHTKRGGHSDRLLETSSHLTISATAPKSHYYKVVGDVLGDT